MKHTPSTNPFFPPVILQQHNAILGKTGSGKTITGKLMVEQVFLTGVNICVLDPIKSDWWGMTLDADGKRPGLPFDILGGPYGHVPLHADAGEAIGNLVATGALRYSIIDMAEFGPGEHNKFFVDFAEALFTAKTRDNGVVYLVLEEAHVFCPKERDGVKGENMAIFWMKRLASAARSKGIRIIALTQRTQSLHNAVLGSCDTVIAHRLTLPADKAPVVEWLKGNTGPETTKLVTSTLSSLKTGEGWICSNEGDGTRQAKFPMIRTYDNSATPTGEVSESSVRPPPVDQAKLRSIIGDALKEAEATDPTKLRERVAELEEQLADATASGVSANATQETDALLASENLALRERLEARDREDDEMRAWVRGVDDAIEAAVAVCGTSFRQVADCMMQVEANIAEAVLNIPNNAQAKVRNVQPPNPVPHRRPEVATQNHSAAEHAVARPTREMVRPSPSRAPVGRVAETARPSGPTDNGDLSTPHLRILAAIVFWKSLTPGSVVQPTRYQVAAVAQYAVGAGTFRNRLGELRTKGLVDYPTDGSIDLTPAGKAEAAKHPDWRLRFGSRSELHSAITGRLSGPQQAILQPLLDNGGKPMSRADLGRVSNYEPTAGTFRNRLGELRSLGLVDYPSDGMAQAEAFLFPGGLR